MPIMGDTMSERRKIFGLKTQGALFVITGAAVAGVFIQFPTEKCVVEQTAMLLNDAYAYVPERAGDAAREMCARNSNQPIEIRYFLAQANY